MFQVIVQKPDPDFGHTPKMVSTQYVLVFSNHSKGFSPGTWGMPLWECSGNSLKGGGAFNMCFPECIVCSLEKFQLIFVDPITVYC